MLTRFFVMKTGCITCAALSGLNPLDESAVNGIESSPRLWLSYRGTFLQPCKKNHFQGRGIRFWFVPTNPHIHSVVEFGIMKAQT